MQNLIPRTCAIPAVLKELPNWVLWKYVVREGQEKPSKVPHSARTLRPCSSTKPEDWCAFETVCRVFEGGGFDGLGFVFTEEAGILGVDIDGETETRWVEKFGSYTEYSPSGKGLHILVRGKKPGKSCRKGGKELYSSARFFTVTGDVLPGYEEIVENQAAIDEYYAAEIAPPVSPAPAPLPAPTPTVNFDSKLSDADILGLMRCASNASKISRLMAGDVSDYPHPKKPGEFDESAADLALCRLVAFYTQDASQIERIFSHSSLAMRKKWQRKDYRDRTISKAISSCTEHFSAQPTQGGQTASKSAAPKPEKKKAKRDATYEDFCDIFKELGYSFALDELTTCKLVNGKEIDEMNLGRIKCDMRDKLIARGLKLDVEAGVNAMRKACDLNRKNVLREYFDNLPAWDGVDRISQLGTCFPNEPRAARWLEVWLSGCVRRWVLSPGEQNITLVLSSDKQEVGKSTFCRWICPIQELFVASMVRPDDKDCRVRLASSLIWEIGELDATTRKADVSALKYFLTLEKVSERRAYAVQEVSRPALACFIGTVNNAGGFLQDTTGNRRFLIVEADGLDWSYEMLDKQQIWAQAKVAALEGKACLTGEEKIARDEVNTSQTIASSTETILNAVYVKTAKDHDRVFSADLLATLRSAGVVATRGTMMEIAAWAKQIGCKKFSTGSQRGYTGLALRHTLTSNNPLTKE